NLNPHRRHWPANYAGLLTPRALSRNLLALERFRRIRLPNSLHATPMENGTVPHAKRLLWAGFFSIFAAGVGFSVRGGILLDWANQYGFTMSELGGISGGGLTGFGVIIIAGSLIADKIGYGRLMVLAFLMHVLSAVLQLGAG